MVRFRCYKETSHTNTRIGVYFLLICVLSPFVVVSKLQPHILLKTPLALSYFRQVTEFTAQFIFYLQVHFQAFSSLIFMTFYG